MTALQSHFHPSLLTPPPSARTPSPQFMLRGLLARARRITSRTTAGSVSHLDEASRLLHIAHTAVLNPRHTHVIEQHLNQIHSTGRRSNVLEVGAGTGRFYGIPKKAHPDADSGTWAINLANRQPFADVIAADWDWSWFHPTPIIHGNLDFSTIDVSQTLPYQPGTFDLIHVKCLLPCLSRYAALIERLAVVLRPGGMLVLVESELGYSSNHPMSAPMLTWNACIKEVMQGRGVDPALPTDLVRFIGSSGVFSSAVYHQEASITCATTSGGMDCLAGIGRVHPDLMSANLDRQLAELVKFGYSEGDLWNVKEAVRQELSSNHTPYRQRIFAVYATKLGY